MRNLIHLNQDWRFIQKDAGLPQTLPEDWQKIDLPHSWNAVDGHDGNGSFDRGRYWYAKSFETPRQPLAGGRVYVEFPAAGQQATVYVNGTEVAYHEGGYSAFRADVTDLCAEEGENLLVVACSNENKSSVYPQAADFTFYGGLYRGVNLISVPAAHFDLDYFGGPGLQVTPVPCECGGATFEMVSWVTGGDENFTVLYSVKDAQGREVASAVRPADQTKVTVYVPDVTRWDIDNPYLYTVTATLQRRNEAYDEISARVGVRSFSCDPQKGFIINGAETPLRGVSRHQDQLYKGNALSREDHYSDARIIKELGANTIRLAHYQHSQDFYDACDELGFVIWAEIPFISVMNPDPAAHQNCISQMKELIIQNYNHPCICFWGVSNEILIGGISEQLVENHKELNALCKELDPTRLTTIAHVSMTPIESPMHGITDVESYNHYFGWYGGKTEENGPWLDNFHKVHPEICLGLSEYGCEGIITYHGPNPACKDYSEEYQALYHEHMAKVLDERPWMWSSHVWNMFDFGCAARNEGGVAGRNNKGLVTMDRKTKKDSYYVYQAYWSKTPMVHLCGKRYAQRAGETTEVKVYSNQPTVALYLNGKLVEEKSADKVFAFTVALEEGFNIVVAAAGSLKDSMTLEKVDKEPSIYVLPEVNERAEGVANWFKLAGDLDLEAPMEFPEGKYSVKDTMEELSKCPEAFEIVHNAVKLATNFDVAPGVGMWDMMKGMTPEKMCGMMGSAMPKGFLESINAKLIKIDKK
ncbi:MAG: glycoside hydrolase family 2 protein [Lachnospiraceae bacterium]|nr:glycoside hydrolase family 2 TIM barrel-domain containing protein [uncultured Acetatifactor sp.]MCI9219293.1 glycoside hydrolase family 2 protein [Lachnospiraceae bacterium]